MLYGTSVEETEQSWEENEQHIRQMYQTIETLTPQTQKILKLCYFRQMKYREVAEELNISVSAVRKHIVQALKALRLALKNKRDG